MKVMVCQMLKNVKCTFLLIGMSLATVSAEAGFGDLLKSSAASDAGKEQGAVKQNEGVCPKCNGTGSVARGLKTKKCKVCGGTGAVRQKKSDAAVKPAAATGTEPVAESAGTSAQMVLDDITTDELKAALAAKKGYLLLDVREPSEFSSGHLKMAVNVPVGQIAARIGSVCTDKTREIYVYCQSGKRSRVAAQRLSRMGYTKVHNVLGGVNVWTGELVR